jgi:hypothetical protein
MRIAPKSYKDVYQSQETRGQFQLPPSGTYHAVNVRIERQEIGSKGTKRVQVWTRFLAVIEVDDTGDANEAKSWIGKDTTQSLWWDLSKKGNQERVACMAIANGCMDEFDPDNDNELVGAITGVPYQIKGVLKDEEWEGKKNRNWNVLATQAIGASDRKKYMDAPDWKKTAGDASSRMTVSDKRSGGGGNKSNGSSSTGRSSEQGVDPFGDIPF